MWLTGSYDPDLNLVYWTVGNPGPQIDRSTRGDLDNLFSDSVVALDPDTGAAQVALPVHAERRPRLGLVPGSDPGRSRLARTACASCCCTPIATACSTCSIAPPDSSCPRRRSSTRTGTRGFDAAGGRSSCPARTRAGRQLLRLSHRRRRHQLSGAVLQPAHRLDVSANIAKSGQRYVSAAGRLTKPAASTSAGSGRGRPCGAEAGRAGRVRRHQGARPRNRQDDVGLQDRSRAR